MSLKTVNVLVVEDSPVMRMLLTQLLRSDPRIRVLGTADDGETALAFLEKNRPDVVLMDVNMPKLNGLEATRRIMQTRPVPVVMCSAVNHAGEVSAALDAMDAGAVAFLEKPPSPAHPEFGAKVRDFLRTVIAMAGVKAQSPDAGGMAAPANGVALPTGLTAGAVRVVAIGGCVGGPQALQALLRGLPRNLPAPVLVALSVAGGFLAGVVERLGTVTGFPVGLAVDGIRAEPGRAYFAPDGMQLTVAADGTLTVRREPVPAGTAATVVGPLFASVTRAFGGNAIGVLLSGLSEDGAAELKAMREQGAVTIAQDAASAVVHGLPGAAIRLGGVTHILSPTQTAAALTAWLRPAAGATNGIQTGA